MQTDGRWRVVMWVFLLTLIACQPQVEIVRVETTSEAPAVREVTREVWVTPPGAGLATPGTPRPSPTLTPAVTASPLPPPGTEARPVRLLFPDSVPAAVVNQRGEVLAEALQAATGLHFVVEQPAGTTAQITALCAAPQESVAFLSPLAYVLAHDECDAQVSHSAARLDLDRQMSMIVVRSDSDITTLQDLEDKIWAAPAANSLAHNFYVQAMLAQAGVTPAEELYFDSDNAALLALVNGEADFATATFMPPLLPLEERPWQYGNDDPDLWRQLGVAPNRHPLGYIVVAGLPENGGYRVRDARAGLFDVRPDIFTETRILTVTAPLPLDTVAVGPQFPLATARQLNQALAEFVASDDCQRSLCSSDFLNWSGVQTVEEGAYAPLRFMMRALDVPAGFWWTVAEGAPGGG